MKLRSKLSALLATAGFVGMLASAPGYASYTALGVTWDPTKSADFKLEPSSPFQYFTNGATPTVTGAFDPNPVTNLFNGGAFPVPTQYMQGFGQFQPPGINGAAGGSVVAGSNFTFVYNGLNLVNVSNSGTVVTGLLGSTGSIDLHVDPTAAYSAAATTYNTTKSNANFQAMQDAADNGPLFLRLKPRALADNPLTTTIDESLWSTSQITIQQIGQNLFVATTAWLFDIDTTVGDPTAIAALNTNTKALGSDFQISFTTQFDTTKTGVDKYWGDLAGNITGKSNPQVPEPASLALFGIALAGLGLARRRRS